MAVNNNIMVRLLVIEITFLILAVVNSYPAFEDSEFKHKNRDKGRTIRGFKNMDLSTARGFGKRTDHYMNLMPLDLFVDNKEDSFNQNIPMEVSLEKILKNKYKNFIEKLIDVNHDGYISGEELLQSIDDIHALKSEMTVARNYMINDEYFIKSSHFFDFWITIAELIQAVLSAGFIILTSAALLVTLACVVHYDLLGLFLAHSYGRRIVYTDNERHQYRPSSEFDHLWIPRPGTDPNTLYLLPQPVTVQDHGGDVEDYWADSDDVISGVNNNRGTTAGRLSDGEVHRWEPAPDTVVDRVPTTTTTEEPDDRADDDGDDYVAPGQEWDDDVF